MKKAENIQDSKDVHIHFDRNDRGHFVLMENGEQTGLMTIGIKGSNLTVYHTELSEKLRDQGGVLSDGRGPELIDAMVAYARAHQLLVIPLCPFVHDHFRRHSEQYKDVWNRGWHF